jgi:hypothetical protein
MKFDPVRRKAMTAVAALPLAAALGETQATQLLPPANPVPAGLFADAGETCAPATKEDYARYRLGELQEQLAVHKGQVNPFDKIQLRDQLRNNSSHEDVECLKSVSKTNRVRIAAERRVRIDREHQIDMIQAQIDDLMGRHPFLRTIQSFL